MAYFASFWSSTLETSGSHWDKKIKELERLPEMTGSIRLDIEKLDSNLRPVVSPKNTIKNIVHNIQRSLHK